MSEMNQENTRFVKKIILSVLINITKIVMLTYLWDNNSLYSMNDYFVIFIIEMVYIANAVLLFVVYFYKPLMKKYNKRIYWIISLIGTCSALWGAVYEFLA